MGMNSKPRRLFRRRRVVASALVAVSLVSVGPALGGVAAAQTTTTKAGKPSGEVKIGIINDTSGPNSPFSTVTQEGLLLAVNEINKSGGFGGKKITLVQDSDGGDATQTPALVRKQAGEGVVAILLTTGSASALGAKPVCVEVNVVCLHPTSPSGALSAPPNNGEMFTVAPTVDQLAAALGGAMAKTKVKKLAVLEDNSPTIKGVNDALIPALEKYGLKVVAREAVPLNATDASAEVARVKSSDPDAVLLSDLGGQTEITMINALHDQMPTTPKFGKVTIPDQPDTWKLANPGALDGVVYAQTIDTRNPRVVELEKKLKKKLKSKFLAMSDYYAWGYDGVYLLRTAAENAEAPSLTSAMEQIGGYKPHFGQEPLTLSYTPTKHAASDNLCAISFLQFGKDNKPKKLPWKTYQPPC